MPSEATSVEIESEESGDEKMVFKKPKKRKRGRPKKTTQNNTDTELSQMDTTQGTSQENILTPNSNILTTNNSTQSNTKQINFSDKMKEIRNKTYNHLFYITATIDSRTKMSDIWDKKHPNSTDVIIKTKKGFLLKSDTSKSVLVHTLKTLISEKKIINYAETTPYTTTPRSQPADSYCAIIATVEHEIDETQISDYLNKCNIVHRYCKRIVSKQTNKPTKLIRFITGCVNSYQKLLSQGLFYKNLHYPVYPALPPAPAPQPCSRCEQFTHKTEDCKTPIKCNKCGGNHHTRRCTSELPPKCSACNEEGHSAWSFKCPQRPTQPIAGIPNNPIRSINKKTRDLDGSITRNSKIHSPVTIHDMIINTYIDKINNPKHTNREELIQKLRKKFISQYNIDTSAVFSGNRLYILMFDLNSPQSISPTEPTHGTGTQIHVDNVA
jgi:hypothetical protein